MRSNIHLTHALNTEYKEEDAEEEKIFNAHTTEANAIPQETIIINTNEPLHSHKSNKHGISFSWLHKQKLIDMEPHHGVLCDHCDDDITKCKAIKHIIDLLEFYKLHQTTLSRNEEQVIPLFEYVSSLKNYGVFMFLEDWYQCRQNHFKTPKDIRYFQNIEAINCDHKSCIYVRRYQRDRTHAPQHDPYKEIDYKNIILMDELNSIHTFIFHWMPSRFKIIATSLLSHDEEEDESDSNDCDHDAKQNIAIDDDAEEEDRKEQQNGIHLWANGPKPMSQCNVEQIAFLLTHEIVDKVTKLKQHKEAIVKFIRDNAFDGVKLSQTKRKQFAAQLVEHFDNTKLRMSFIKLYKHIWDYNNPQYVTPEPTVPITIDHDNNKFVTTSHRNSELSYFALGEQYRYTNNFKGHPLYIEPKFGSLKDEFADFFERQLRRTQQKRIKTFTHPNNHDEKKHLRPASILKSFVTEKREYSYNDFAAHRSQMLFFLSYFLQNDKIKIVTVNVVTI